MYTSLGWFTADEVEWQGVDSFITVSKQFAVVVVEGVEGPGVCSSVILEEDFQAASASSFSL